MRVVAGRRNESVLSRIAGIMVAFAAVGAAADVGAADPSVRIPQGALRGASVDGINSYKGIPYALPPVGERRWRAPEPGPKWQGIRDATLAGAACVQFPEEAESGPQSEDCLFLNVWQPATATSRSKLPVMVWIHGGGFVAGSASRPGYDGSELARKGVILVSFNYRLGRLGLFAHPALTAENPPGQTGSYTLMDQIAALQWVRDNIAKFGGDPANVTIFGQSSGGISINTLMVSPAASGLIAKAISQSGRGRNEAFPIRGEGNALPLRGLTGMTGEKLGVAFAATLGVQGTGVEALRALRALPPRKFIGPLGGDLSAGAYLDGSLLVESVPSAFAAGREAKVPYMIGAASCERCNVASIRERPEETLAQAGQLRDQVLAVYGESLAEAAVDLAGDIDHVEPSRHLARLHTANGQKTWAYSFGYLPQATAGEYRDTPHGGDVAFVFKTPGIGSGSDGRSYQPTSRDLEIADAMATYWTNFAKHSDPRGAGSVVWPSFDSSQETFLSITATGAKAVPHFRQGRLDVVEQIAATRR